MDSQGSNLDKRQFEALCLPYRNDLLRLLFWLCRDRSLAEDVLQETLVRAWRSIQTLTKHDAVKPWLITIARRELARTFERKRPETVDIDSIAELDSGTDASDDHTMDEVRRAIMSLEQSYREPLVLQVLFGYSTDEIAKELNISLGAVLTRLFRARQQLRKQLMGAADEEDAS